MNLKVYVSLNAHQNIFKMIKNIVCLESKNKYIYSMQNQLSNTFQEVDRILYCEN